VSLSDQKLPIDAKIYGFIKSRAGLLISKYRVLPILYRRYFLISMELSPILVKRVIDKVSAILLGRKYRDTNIFARPTTLERRKDSTSPALA